MSNLLQKTVLGAVTAVAMAGAAQSATLSISGGSFGAIPDGATNEGLMPLFGVASLDGYYGSTINLVGNSTLRFEVLGAEAGNTNTFTFTPTGQSLVDAGGGSFFDIAGISGFDADAIAGLLGFMFTTSAGPTSVANGSNPDNTIPSPSPGINFFASFGGAATSGSVLYLFFDDDGANNDDNHDDLVIRISAVPLPAGGLLLIGGLGALTLLRRRKAA